jgi:hypothetical protein
MNFGCADDANFRFKVIKYVKMETRNSHSPEFHYPLLMAGGAKMTKLARRYAAALIL